jgi:hypothetical protein
MKKLLCVALIFIVGSFWACKKAEENKPAEGKQVTNNKQIQKPKRNRRGKGGVRPGLEIFQEEKLVVSIPRDQYVKITNTTIKVNGTDYKAILLTDLLKSHNVSGKFVNLKGPNRTATLTWEQVTTNPIYLYSNRNRFQTFHTSKALDASEIPTVVGRIDVGSKSVPSETKTAPTKKT